MSMVEKMVETMFVEKLLMLDPNRPPAPSFDSQNAKSLCTLCYLGMLLAWRNKHAFFLGVMSPSTCSCFTTMLLSIPFDSLFKLRSEVSN